MLHFRDFVYRAHDPRWAFNALSGDGAKRHGGRFNPQGVPALYTSLTQTVALAEYHQGFPHRPQPTTLCTYEVDCSSILDLTDPGILKSHKIDASDLACAWELLASNKVVPPSWTLANKLIKRGIAGIIAPSFTPNAPAEGKNLIFWRWAKRRPHKVTVIDDFSRLPQDQDSWK